MDRKATNEMTRDEELNKLVGDSGFLRYHAEYAKRREFNAFDVLRYAEYEIRHSNVLAWLLDPNETTHGIGRTFLEWFLGQARLPGKMPGNIVCGDGGQQVRVEREQHYVDVTIFLQSDQGRHIVAIENKPGQASPGHYEQARQHVKRLRPKYPGHEIHGVLLSSSREGIDGQDGIAHVSWRDVGAQIKTMHGTGAFGKEEVAAFIRQYLVAVARMIGPEESDAHYFQKLLREHSALLKQLIGVLDKKGDDGVGELVPEEYRGTVVRLVKDFRVEPVRLRSEVRAVLNSRGIRRTALSSSGTTYWLKWDLDAARELGVQGCLRWGIRFEYGSLAVQLNVPPKCRGTTGDVLERIKSFMREAPVDRRRRDRYPMWGSGYFYIYRRTLLGGDVLSALSATEVRERTLAEVKRFLDSDTSDYRRINDYFRCLAFRVEVVAASVAEEAQ